MREKGNDKDSILIFSRKNFFCPEFPQILASRQKFSFYGTIAENTIKTRDEAIEGTIQKRRGNITWDRIKLK